MDPEDKYWQALRFEHDLINRRITWLLTSQSILISAYLLILQKADALNITALFIDTLKWVGLFVSICIFVSIVSAFFAKRYAWKTYKKESGKFDAPFGVRTWTTIVGFLAEGSLCIIFIVVWIFFLCS